MLHQVQIQCKLKPEVILEIQKIYVVQQIPRTPSPWPAKTQILFPALIFES